MPAREVVGYAIECLEREAMRLSEQIDLFSLPVEMWGGGKQAIRQYLADKVRARLDVSEPDPNELEREYERQAVKEAQEAFNEGDYQRGERILAIYAQQAQKRAAEAGLEKAGDRGRLEGDVKSLRQAIAQGVIR